MKLHYSRIFTCSLLFFCQAASNCNSQALLLSPERAVELAFANNSQVKNSELRVKEARLLEESAIELPAINFNYYYGQLHSVYNDKGWEVSQGLGSIPTHFLRLDLADKKLELSQAELETDKRDLQMKVRSAYYGWIYKLNRKVTAEQELDLGLDFLKTVKQRFEKGEIGDQVMNLALTKQAEVEKEFLNAEDEVYISEITLKQLILSDDSIIPENPELEMVAILPSTDSLKRFSADVQLKQIRKQLEVKMSEWKLEKWKFFPELRAGYFNQNIGGISGFHGWEAGLSFPLWFLPQKAAAKRAQIETEIASNNFTSMQFIMDKTIEGLLAELNKAFRQISYSEKYSLSQADASLQLSMNKFHREEIGYLEYLEAISKSMKTKFDFLESIDNYNQIALKLEYFISNP